MDPITAVSLASSAITLVAAAYNAVELCREIYEHGATQANARVAETAGHLRRCCADLDDSRKDQTQPSELGLLSARCRNTAQQLAEEVAALQSGPNGRRAALLKYMKTKRRAKEMGRLEKELDEYQKIINTRVLVDLRSSIQAIEEKQLELHVDTIERFAALESNLKSNRATAAIELRALIQRIISDNQREHIKTRQHVDHALEGLVLSQARDQLSKDERQRVLDSLYFPDMNLRANEIADRYPETYEWIFEDFKDRRWDRFDTWLTQGTQIYWIYGKPGSGKSTLMRFIVSNEQTYHKLNTWSGGKRCVVLEFYFWLSGGKMQHSMKGFLCSLLYQLFGNEQLQEIAFGELSPAIKMKRQIQDWQPREVKTLIKQILEVATKDLKVCIFIDGLDEFDQDDDRGQLLDFLEYLCQNPAVKLCLSSRPEFPLQRRLSVYPKLCLQDLTEADLRRLLEGELKDAFLRERLSLPPKRQFRILVEDMLYKADGVFLWIHYAMQSIRRGISNEEEPMSLEDRLNDLPPGMERLYENMWQRLNGDQQRYKEEASMIFSSVLAYTSYRVLTLFELMLAVRPDLRQRYFKDLKRQNERLLRDECREFKKRIETRCAGLLECKPRNSTSPFRVPVKSLHRASSFPGCISPKKINSGVVIGDSRRNVFEQHGRYEAKTQPLRNENDKDNQKDLYLGEQLTFYLSMRVSFIHRTAIDFLRDTTTGQAIARSIQIPQEQIIENLCEAEMCAFLHFGSPPDSKLWAIIDNITKATFLSLARIVTLLQKLKRIYDAKFAENSLTGHMGFIGNLILKSTSADILHLYLKQTGEILSSMYLGQLVLADLQDMNRGLFTSVTRRFLVRAGADLRCKQYDFASGLIQSPVEVFIAKYLRYPWSWRYDSGTMKAATKFAMEFILPSMEDTDAIYTIRLELPVLDSGHIAGLVAWLEIGAFWIFSILFPQMIETNGDEIKPNELSNISYTNKTANLLAFWHSKPTHIATFGENDGKSIDGQYYKKLPDGRAMQVPGDWPITWDFDDLQYFWQTSPSDASQLGKFFAETILTNLSNLDPKEALPKLIDGFASVKPRCQMVDAVEWELSMGLRRKSQLATTSRPLVQEAGEMEWEMERDSLWPPSRPEMMLYEIDLLSSAPLGRLDTSQSRRKRRASIIGMTYDRQIWPSLADVPREQYSADNSSDNIEGIEYGDDDNDSVDRSVDSSIDRF